MEFFNKVFDKVVEWSNSLPTVDGIDIKWLFIIALIAIAALGIVIGLTYLCSSSFKLKKACRKVIRCLQNTDSIDDENVGEFTSECFSNKAPAALKDAWLQYLGVRFGYPSEVVSEKEVYNKTVKKGGNVRANVFLALALVTVGLFAFWNLGSKPGTGAIIACGLILSAIIYVILAIAGKRQYVSARDTFFAMQEDLDAKVNFQVEKAYSTDASPLIELAALADELIAKNTAKEIVIDEAEVLKEEPAEEEKTESVIEESAEEQVSEENIDGDAQTPDENTESEDEDEMLLFGRKKKLAEEKAALEEMYVEAELVEEDEFVESELIEEEPEEETVAVVETEETAEEAPVEESSAEEETAEEVPAEETAEEVPAEETAEEAEETAEEEAAEEETVEEPVADEAPVEQEEEVVYVVEGEEEEEEVKAPKLAKLPLLMDYILQQNFSRDKLIKIAMLLLSVYSSVKDSPENKAIVIQCMVKLLPALRVAK